MKTEIELTKGKHGTKAIIKSEWRNHYYEILTDNHVVELELNDSKGWKGDCIDFIRHFSHIKSLTLIDMNIKNIQSINELYNLEDLSLITYSKNSVDFSNFPKLTTLDFEWINGSTSLFDLKHIQDLSINRYSDKNLELFSKLTSLNRLSLMNSRINSLDNICQLTNLNSLSLINLTKVENCSCLSNLTNLEDITIHSCKKISDISPLFSLQKIKKMHILDMGIIQSISGIEVMTNLKEFLFYESTNIIDGDLIGLTKLPNIEKVIFQNRKHYTHKREEFVCATKQFK